VYCRTAAYPYLTLGRRGGPQLVAHKSLATSPAGKVYRSSPTSGAPRAAFDTAFLNMRIEPLRLCS
jgi:hypothetical protein